MSGRVPQASRDTEKEIERDGKRVEKKRKRKQLESVRRLDTEKGGTEREILIENMQDVGRKRRLHE